MLKLNASYSKKVPVEGQEFSSQQYHAAVELELSDASEPGELATRIHETFALVRDSVERELHGQAVPVPARDVPQRRGGEKASNRQVQFLTDLALRKGHTPASLTALVQEQYGVAGLYDLDRKQASRLIDTLSQKKAA